jgi:hypothetical protein
MALARPMPLAAPVTIADLPFNIFIVFPREKRRVAVSPHVPSVAMGAGHEQQGCAVRPGVFEAASVAPILCRATHHQFAPEDI